MSHLMSHDAPAVTMKGRIAGAGRGLAAIVLRKVLAAMEKGGLTFILPDGARVECRGRLPGPEATIVIHDMSALRRLLFSGDVAFAEAFVRGEWSSPDLAAAIEVAAVNGDSFMRAVEGSAPARFANWIAHRLRANSPQGSRRNIAAHYDLGNAFYSHWLDPDMYYSSGLYRAADETLEEGQRNKVERVLDLLDARNGESVLEIGCGWGGLAVAMAKRGAGEITGLTLSKEQLAHAQGIVDAHGLQSRIDLRLQDYRDAGGTYDRIVSIEMIEAVGREYWPAYFSTLRDRLAPNGHAIVQAITIADQRFEKYVTTPDFIQRYIFPGGVLPCPRALQEEATRAGLRLETIETFGDSYARTLVEWRRRLHNNWRDIEALGFDASFRRLWDYYLCYCEGGFRAGAINVGLYKLSHAQSQ
ncbi:SAM-dependent methyltransferase [Methylocystis echinoides]|uniref:Cyclopropane-fatty-acyl-phospholipid synthase n=1 Tax=Methylocystis echinoides TaxID=29468 RepID=A0A9W6LSU3_9HYPH|nr:cyclopropane-fatty-acyl-phospholipid synthase family protein [Methylocystis echinoides]GLI93847.1 cyclopropane-fatty-acyl-phospholipid synthase [Methylocystis echinoides]